MSAAQAKAWPRQRWPDVVVALAVTSVAVVIRGAFVVHANFPLNDGGLFAAVIADIAAEDGRLPTETTYNDAGIPLAYPPLGFYMARLFGAATGMETLDTLRFLPYAFSCVTVTAVFVLFRFYGDRSFAGIGALFFALVPRSYDWEISGGGLTRSPGFFFAISALLSLAHLSTRGPSKLWAATAGAFGGAAALCHLEMGLFALYSGVLIVACSSRRSRLWSSCATALMVAALVVGPWGILTVTQVGLGPYVAAAQTGTHGLGALQIFSSAAFNEPLFPLFAALAGVGLAQAVGEKRWFLPGWVLVTLLADPRKAETLTTVPLAALAALGLMRGILPLLTDATVSKGSPFGWMALTLKQRLALYACVGFMVLASVLAPQRSDSPVKALTPELRAALGLVRESTPSGSRVAVVTGSESWALDAVSEWFPVLASRVSVATVQGTEWLPERQFRRAIESYAELQRCAHLGVQCLEEWKRESDSRFDFVFIPGNPYRRFGERDQDECCAALASSLSSSGRYRVVFVHPGGSLFAATDATSN